MGLTGWPPRLLLRREQGRRKVGCSQVIHPEDSLMFGTVLLANGLHFVWPSWLPLLQFWLVLLPRLLLLPLLLPLRLLLRRSFLLSHC
jgi:hypothetical protein